MGTMRKLAEQKQKRNKVFLKARTTCTIYLGHLLQKQVFFSLVLNELIVSALMTLSGRPFQILLLQLQMLDFHKFSESLRGH